MGYWVSSEINTKIDALKWHVFDIPNGYVPGRAGVAVLRHTARDGWGDMHIFVDGVVAARRRGGGDWGFTVNAFVPAGCTVTFGHGGVGGIEYFKFMEF
ncbi:TPA: hypothetical protein ACQZF0_002175 [Escherichia coli]|uniref:hypothetical protein n=1 Tax=Escherichia coli TaxID=562 RepID=UPI000B3BFB36|nr:hypothetical protein [Escherichia coli]EBE2295114.1 hypothetical protein [Salmonella enterica]ARV36383.1 hypothetical protein BUQ71_18275 [Escherichia coli]EFB2750250.1 hypothetical protein [Escherichia coli]EFB2773501.1 hypothetical protein [Escherichia coli]EFB6074967.1 hypothetical protein [Escherichia coli]